MQRAADCINSCIQLVGLCAGIIGCGLSTVMEMLSIEPQSLPLDILLSLNKPSGRCNLRLRERCRSLLSNLRCR